MVSTDKKGGLVTAAHKKLFAALLTGLMFVLPYERIPSLPISLAGMSVDLRLSFLFGAALILLVIWCLAFARQKITVHLKSFHYLLLGFVFVYLLSALLSEDLKRALTVWLFTVFTILVGICVGMVWQYRNADAVRKALWLTTWIVLAFGAYQYIGDVIGLPSSMTGLRDIYTKSVFGFPRIQSTALEPLFFANFLLIPFYYFASRFLSGQKERPIFLVAVCVELVLTVSRGALIGGSFGLLLLVLIYFRRSQVVQKAGLIGLVVVGTSLALLLTNVNNLNLFTGDSSSIPSQTPATSAVINQATNLTSQDDRVRNRSLAWEAFTSRPLLGVGPGNFSAFAKERYPAYRSEDSYVVVNNEPLELLAESGMIGFLLLIAFVLAITTRLVMLLTKDPSVEDYEWSAALLAYLLALSIQYQTFSTLYIMHIWVVLGIAMGVITSSPLEPQVASESKQSISKKKSGARQK